MQKMGVAPYQLLQAETSVQGITDLGGKVTRNEKKKNNQKTRGGGKRERSKIR